MSSNLKQWLGCLLVLCLVISCFKTYAQSKIPATWTDDMVLKVTYGGGMRDYSSTIEIKKTGSYMETRDGGKVKRIVLSFSQQELNDLLAVLRTNKFDKIETEPVMIYDKGTTSTTLSWGEQAFGVSDGSSSMISKEYQQQYQAIRTYISKMVQE